MPIQGAKPKPEGTTRHRVKPVTEWRDVSPEPFVGGPKLPPHPSAGQTWPKWTRRWWAVVSTMPHCILWDESDWEFAIESATVAAEFHKGDMRQAKEIRDRERKMGMTFDDRRDLRIRYVDKAPEEEDTEGVTSLADYRAALAD